MSDGFTIRIQGQVQGVGFRPFVFQLAHRFGATGGVLNDAEGVLIHIRCTDIEGFQQALRTEKPALARIDRVICTPAEVELSDDFQILASGPSGADTRVTPDAATCPDCVEEIRGHGRRRGYSFTNCTNCGPRFTILRHLPYDRAQTSMAPFEMCAACRSEYEDPLDRRFHAQPIACPACGPRLALQGDPGGDPIGATVDALLGGKIVAIKGLGGFHIACDATNAEAVARLRARKRRPTKPFALMGRMDHLRPHAEVSPEDALRLQDPAAPIVLLMARGAALPDMIAPGVHELGWMLPYTPLHHLLLDGVDRPLVMTSGNLSGEPQVIGNDEAQAKLSGIADLILDHDRDILRRLDDSVERVTRHGPMILRRARGRVPGTLPLPGGFEDAPDLIAYGAHLKSAICLTKNGQALLSHHLGDLDDPLTWEEFLKADEDYRALFDHRPVAVACDRHPDYRSSRHAAATGLPVIEVQHHHAHLAACLGENLWPREKGAVAGIVLDGLGLGADGTVWGGELLLGDYAGVERHAWLTPAPLPGGDAASRDPWRNLLARLDRAGFASDADRLIPGKPRDVMRQAIKAGVNAPLSSSAGRLFDAVAAMLGFAGAQSYEGEAAMRLEALARTATMKRAASGYAFEAPTGGGALDDRAFWDAALQDLRRGITAPDIALRFHAGFVRGFTSQARRLVESGEARAVALTGGCFQNALLLDLALEDLADVPVLIHREVPANDGGLALGQALIALAQMETK